MSLSEKVNSSKLPENQIHKSTQEKNPTHFQMPTNTSALSTYDRLIHSNNTTEEVVKIGGMIQQDFFNLTNVTSWGGGGFISPASHTGNWKTSFLFNCARLISYVFSLTVLPAKILTPKNPNSLPSTIPINMPSSHSSSAVSVNKGSPQVSNQKKVFLNQLIRKKRVSDGGETSLVDYDLNEKNIATRLGVTIDATCQTAMNNLRKAINRYNALKEKNSREGQYLLVKQAEFLNKIQTRLRLPTSHQSTQVMNLIKSEFKSHQIEVEKVLHGIWIAGSPPDGTDEYIKVFLQTYDEHKFFFWVDNDAYGAAKFSSILKSISLSSAIKKLRELVPTTDQEFIKKYDDLKNKYESSKDFQAKEAYSKELMDLFDSHQRLNEKVKSQFNALFLKEMVIAQDGFFNFCLLKGINKITDAVRIEYLKDVIKVSESEINDYKNIIDTNRKKIQDLVSKVNKDLGSNKVLIKDIKELQSMQSPENIYNYELEMLLRWNYAAASDQLRMYMLKEFGGIYTDLDMMPQYSTQATQKIFEYGGNRFFESLKIRRIISYAALKAAIGQTVSWEQISREIDTSNLQGTDKENLTKLFSYFQETVKSQSPKSLFQTMSPTVIRDQMPILQRYHKWSTKWNVRGLNGLMMSHKGSAVVDSVIIAQQQAYAELKSLRQNILSGEFSKTLSALSEIDQQATVGGYLLKKYLAGSVFYDFRQDSIVPGALSTLAISGPDLIMKEMRKYFISLGPIGEDFLENNGRRLGKAAFLGAYNEVRLDEGKVTFDWLNPISIGVNDVTPADESTWCGFKQKCATDLLFNEKTRDEATQGITRTTVNPEEFTKLWNDVSKFYLPPKLLEEFNQIITKPATDIAKIAEVDQSIYQTLLELPHDPKAKESLFSLQLQLAELLRTTKFPVSNQVHFFLNWQTNFEADLKKSVQLYLKAHPQTKVVLWNSELSNRVLFLKDMLAVAERHLAVSNLLDSVDKPSPSFSDITTLTKYAELKSKESLDLLTPTELDDFLDITSKIAEDQQLQEKISSIENQLNSGSFYKELEQSVSSWLALPENEFKQKVLSLIRDLSHDGSLDSQGQKRLNQWYQKICTTTFEKRVSKIQEKIQSFTKQFENNERVIFKNIDDILSDHPLFRNMQQSGYIFRDFNDITRLMLSQAGISGIISSESVFPAPSKALVDILKTTSENDYGLMQTSLSQVYDFLSSDQNSPEGKQSEQNLAENLREELQKYSPEELLIPPIESDVTAIGVRYSIENGKESEKLLLSLSPGIFNPAGYTMGLYLEALYAMHTEIQKGSLTIESAENILKNNKINCFIQREPLQKLCEYASNKSYLSLTEIHQALTGQTHLAEATKHLIGGALPGVSHILTQDNKYGRPLATAMTFSPTIAPYDYRGSGFSKDLFSNPHNAPKIPVIVESAKYSASSWSEFSNTHLSGWSDLANHLGAKSISIHPQNFLYETEGRCMGFSILYMLANDPKSYALLQENLVTLSSLFQEKEKSKLPLTQDDQDFLSRSLELIDWWQHQGNKLLMSGSVFTSLPWDLSSLRSAFNEKKLNCVLVTTPAHSLILHKINDVIGNTESTYRVTDPNFGHIDFPTLEKAMYFLSSMLDLSPEIRSRYGITSSTYTNELKIYSVNTEELSNIVFSGTDLGLASDHQLTTREKLMLKGEVKINHMLTTWETLFDIGATIDQQRISERVQPEDFDRIKIHGDILNDYLSRNVLDHQQANLIRVLLETHGVQQGTKKIQGKLITETPNHIAPLLQGVKSKISHVQTTLQIMIKDIKNQLRMRAISDNDEGIVKKVDISDNDLVTVEIESKRKKSRITLQGANLARSFRQMSRMLNELSSTGVMDMELGMSIVSLVQYARMVQEGKSSDALAKMNLFLDVKALSESTLGSIIQAMGNKFITEAGIQGFRLESALAAKLHAAASKTGGTLGQALSNAARILELPILETVAGVWNLYNSVNTLLEASSHSDQMAARVQIAFDTISLGLTLSSIASPSFMLAAGPIAAIGMGAASIARNIAKHEERHETWLKYKAFLDQGSKHVVQSFPSRGLIDLSENSVLGNVCLDLRKNPPTLTGSRSYNANRWIGHHPNLTDKQIRERLSYAYSITPQYALAKGHANSYWPQDIPKIPKGTYHTVILGYGIQYKAVTEVIYLSNQIVWREAVMETDSRYYVPPLTPQGKQSTVIGGDTFVTVLPVRLLDEDSEERLALASSYADYKINIQGGRGGVVVQVGGAGNYILTGEEFSNNIISFRAIPPPYSVHFDLTQAEQSNILVKDNKALNILKIKQSNFNTILGSNEGNDILRGNHHTNFYLGQGEVTVYSGTGSCKYHIPKINKTINITLTEGSTRHYFKIQHGVTDLKPLRGEQENSLILSRRWEENNNDDDPLPRLFIHTFFNNSSQPELFLNGKLTVSLADGITLQSIKKDSSYITGSRAILGCLSCDQSVWQKQYPEEPSYPESIFLKLERLEWPFNPNMTIFQQNGFAILEKASSHITYQIASYSDVTVHASSLYSITVEGKIGCSYIISYMPSSEEVVPPEETLPITIYLEKSSGSVQQLSLCSLLASSIQGKIHQSESSKGRGIDLIVSSLKSKVSVTLFWNNEIPGDTIIEINEKTTTSLQQWYDTLNQETSAWKTLYSNSKLIPERVEDVLGLNNTATVILSKPMSKAHILGIENKHSINLEVIGELQSGSVIASMENRRWSFFNTPLKQFNATIPAHSTKYLYFRGNQYDQGNIVFYSRVNPTSLNILEKPETILPQRQWECYEEIHVPPTTLTLQNFQRYQIADEVQELVRQLMYAQGLVRIQNRDFILKMFYIRQERGVGTVRLRFINFFEKSSCNTEPLLCTGELLIHKSFWDHLILTLGKEKFNLAILAKEFLSPHHTLQLETNPRKKYELMFPKKPCFPGANVFTYTIDPDNQQHQSVVMPFISKDMAVYVLPKATRSKNSYYLDPDTGDLYLTKIRPDHLSYSEAIVHAFLIKFKQFAYNIDKFQRIAIMGSHEVLPLSSGNLVTFSGPALRHIEFKYRTAHRILQMLWKERVVARSISVIPNNDQVLLYDPQLAVQHYKLTDAMMWDLLDRSKNSYRAKTYDSYLIQEAMHIFSPQPKWNIPKSMLQYAVGYYQEHFTQWIRGQISKNSKIYIPKGTTTFSLITTQNHMFPASENTSTITVYYSVYGLNKIADSLLLHSQAGDMTCDLLKDIVLVVKQINESQYSDRKIFIATEVFTEEDNKLESYDGGVILPAGRELQ